MTKKNNPLYLLLLDGKPAGQDDDGYTWFASGRHRATSEQSLRAIQKRIRRAENHDAKSGRMSFCYSYCLVNQ